MAYNHTSGATVASFGLLLLFGAILLAPYSVEAAMVAWGLGLILTLGGGFAGIIQWHSYASRWRERLKREAA